MKNHVSSNGILEVMIILKVKIYMLSISRLHIYIYICKKGENLSL